MNSSKRAKVKRLFTIFIACCFVVLIYLWGSSPEKHVPKIFLDTDISSDVDDVGAVAVLHALADRGDAEILAMAVSSGDPWGAPCLEVLNASFGRPDIPVGKILEPTVHHVSKYTQHIAENYPPHTESEKGTYDATRLYRKILAGQDDKSVTIVTIGYLTNLRELLESSPDEFSPLNGSELVATKVEKLVCMGGEFPSGREWNLYQDVEAASYVMSQWPTKIWFSGFEIGNSVLTGKVLRQTDIDNPLTKAYQLYNNIQNRQSWDQVAVLLASSNGLAKNTYWKMSPPGDVKIDSKGMNTWEARKDGQHQYMIRTKKTEQLAQIIDELMVSPLTNAKDKQE
ncbi:nucleoside hydrolase [Desulforhopalus sp. 52FAK]